MPAREKKLKALSYYESNKQVSYPTFQPDKNPASNRLYCPTRNLAIILEYWWKGKEFEITRVLELLISTGRKSEMDVG